LIQKPLFSNLIDEKAEKFLWVDAATSSGVLGGVLAQKLGGQGNEKFLPEYLDLDNKVHRMIFDQDLPYTPAKLYTKLPIELPMPSSLRTVPPEITKEQPLLGFSQENVHDSFFLSTVSILALYNCKLPDSTIEFRKLAVKTLKKGILNNKLKDFTFNLNFQDYSNFLADFSQGLIGLDPDMYLAESLATALHRPMIFLSTLEKHKEKPIFQYNHELEKPPLIYGIFERQGHVIFTPFFINKQAEFKLDQLKGKVQVIAYMAKTIPETFKSRPILDLEAFALLTALHSFQRFISGVKVKLLTDSRVLFYLFSSKVGNSSVKIRRWCLKILSDYPQVTLHFVRTTENLADFLTREGALPGDLDRFNIKDVKVTDFYAELPKCEFTLPEWIRFVEDHPEYLTINNSNSPKKLALSIEKGISNVTDIITQTDILKQKLSRSEIVRFQKIEFEDIYTNCLASQDFEYSPNPAEPLKYKLISDLLMIFEEFYKILLPPSMIGLLLSHTHLLGHKGLNRMLADLQNYSFPNKNTVTKRFINCCYSCFLSQIGNRKTKIGIYPTPTYPLQEISMDLAENLNAINGYSHLLLVQCALTDFVIIVPLKSKTSAEITRVLTYSVLQHFNVQKIHSDNGPAFRSLTWLENMAALGITVINTSSLHPSGRGQIERLVGTVKLMMKKMLATKPTLNWEYLPYLCARILNNTVCPKTGFKPNEMVFGQEGAGKFQLDTDNVAPPHYLVKTHKLHIERISAEIKEMTRVAREKLTDLRLITNEKINKNKITKTFKPNDYVFVLDRYKMPGNSRPLHTKLHPSPYIVIRPLWTTTLVKRLSDGFMTLYSNNDLKLYQGGSPLFKTLPVEITRVLLHSFQNLLDSDLTTITKHDNMEIPTGIQLFDPLDENEEKLLDYQTHIDQNNPDLTVNDEFAPEISDNQSIMNPDPFTADPDEQQLEDFITQDISQDLNELSKAPFHDSKNNIPAHESDSDESEQETEDTGMKLRSGRKSVRFQ